jgi:Tfp pilus assembly protein PilV
MSLNSQKSVSLIELLIALVLFSIIVLSFTSIDLFSRRNVLTADMRATLQNELSHTLEHMSKNILRAGCDGNNPPFSLSGSPLTGFKIRVDFNNTPANLNDDTWVSYTLSGNTLSCDNEVLSSHIVAGVSNNDPTSGFYFFFTDNSSVIEISLLARYKPATQPDATNPQEVMRTRFYARSCAATTRP